MCPVSRTGGWGGCEVLGGRGVSFRIWLVHWQRLRLEPQHGDAVGAERRQYVDADSPDASIFPNLVQRIKTGFPLCVAPVVPSQSIDMLAMDDAGQSTAQGSTKGQIDAMYYDTTEAGPPDGNGHGGDRSRSSQCVEVKVKKIPHTFSADEYVFGDAKGVERSTKKDDWEMSEYQGERVWFYRGKKFTYFSRKRIG